MNSDVHGDASFKLKIFDELKKILSDDTYGYASDVVTYAEMEGLEFNYVGMAEFRDALTHIKRAIYTNVELTAEKELTSAFEHIRRAAVESMEEYVETKYSNIRKRSDTLAYMFWLARIKKPDTKIIFNSENIIKSNILLGRKAKAKTEWREAISHFRIAEEELVRLDEMLPTIDEISRRLFTSIQAIIILIVGFILGQAYHL